MKVITKVDAVPLAIGIQKVLLELAKKYELQSAKYPVREFERLLMESKGVSKKEAEKVTEKIINTGIIRWEMIGNNFVL